MKTVNNTQSTHRRQFPSLALLLATVTLLAFAPQPVNAGPSYPFHARFITEFEIVQEFPYLHYTVNAQGQATYMGPTTAVTTDQMVSIIDGSSTATYTLTSDSDGVRADTLTLALAFQATDVPSGITFTGTYTVIGGTGRLAAVTGSGFVAGSALLNGPHSGIGTFALSGAVSFGPGE
jgi:hypothetical protein